MKIKSRIIYVLLIILFNSSIPVYSQPLTDKYSNDFEYSKNLDIFISLFKELNQSYVDEINPGKLVQAGIEALLRELDPYTNFIPESEIEDYEMMTTGQYGGIGAIIQRRNEYVIVAEPYEGSAAQKAGIIAGDKILEINGKSAKGKTVEEVSTALKGQPGTSVNVLIEREELKEPLQINIIREKIKIPNIPYAGIVDKNIAYINLNSFTQNAGDEVKSAFIKLRDSVNIKGVILDLRGNGGGLLNEAVNIVNIFVKKGETIVSTKGRIKERNQIHRTTSPAVDTEIPLVILVDRLSASASEIVAGSIQDLDRGVIIGQMTYGKGLVQNIFPLSYNTRVKITVAKYYIPSGRCIQKIDYSHKNNDGESEEIPDSLRTAFKTIGGRTVYDGAGIEPDILLKDYEYSKISVSLSNKHLIFDYATKFKNKYKNIHDISSFVINDSIYNDFVKYISDKDYDYETKSEKILEEFKNIAEKEKYFDAITGEYNILKQKMMHDKKEDLVKFKNEISSLLKQEIVSRYYYQKGRIIASIETDNEINKAVEVLKNPSLYKSILNGSYIKTDN